MELSDKESAAYITKEYCLAQLELVKIDPIQTISQLGMEGRFLNSNLKHKVPIKLISETFDRILISKKEIKNITKDYISYELHSILGTNKELNKIIKKIIKKHKLKPSKNMYILGVFMGKLKDLEKNRNK